MTKKKKEAMDKLPVIELNLNEGNKKLFTDEEIKENDILQKFIGTVIRKVWEIKEEFTEDEIKYWEQKNQSTFIKQIIGKIFFIFLKKGDMIISEEMLNEIKNNLKRNYTKPERLNLYKKIIVKIVEAESIKAKPNIQNICDSINPSTIYNLRQAFDRWKKRNPKIYSATKKDAETKLNI